MPQLVVFGLHIILRLFCLQIGVLRTITGDDFLGLHVVLQQVNIISSELFPIFGHINIQLLDLAQNMVVYGPPFPIKPKTSSHRSCLLLNHTVVWGCSFNLIVGTEVLNLELFYLFG